MAEVAGRLAQLSGSHATGTIQVTEATLNEALRAGTHGGTAPIVRLFHDNLIEVRYGMMHARAVLPVALDTAGAPRVTVVLASTVVAWGLRAAVRQPFVEFNGRNMTIHLASVPALASFRDVWPHVTSAQLSTAPGVLRVHLSVSISGVRHG
jgi:hypothetical protein